MSDPQANNPRKTIFRFRYTVKAHEYVVRPAVVRDAENGGVEAHDLGALVMDERTFNELRAALSGPQFEFFDQTAPGVSR